ncbi:hypothetical protein BWK58_10285, partial [Flavobacterium columnare]
GLYKDYSKQICFQTYSINEIKNDRNKAKEWFNSQKEYWGGNNSCSRILNFWIKKNKNEYDKFINDFDSFVENF